MNTRHTGGQLVPALDKIPYPSSPLMKNLYKTPILLWRLGLGSFTGRLFMILTTWGRKTGLARHTAIEYHQFHGRPHVMAAWPRSDWYCNLQANPLVTIQTAAGTQSMRARRLTSDAELGDIYAYVETHPVMRRLWETLGTEITREAFLEHKERFHLLTFEPTDEPTPPGVPVDLLWVWPVLLAAWFFRRTLSSRVK